MIHALPAPAPTAIVASVAAQTDETRNAAIVREAFTRWRQGTGTVFDLLSPNVRWTIEGSRPSAGSYDRQALEALLAPFNAALAAPLAPTLQSVTATGNQVIVRFTATAPLKRGGTYRNAYAWFLTMRGGRIVAVTAFLDLAAFEAVRETGGASAP
ncbi:ketosteroid isomerase [Sphingomonas spermidinifaciens]|uniref:Ketosteroid isomerase n=1 Tax=Sphingomonas spermidinifaciens TaxID=1141889 RepID=A0A2A4B2R4_9SPHN|nr:nuclear transport factor 2 family protein [Sphingomonas spermidinifaciens]PCD02069.1 ketosteroid isomerase [Sphingomonas spermidinifaciens]